MSRYSTGLKIHKKNPHIWRGRGEWVCASNSTPTFGFGETPKSAYENWAQKNKVQIVLVPTHVTENTKGA